MKTEISSLLVLILLFFSSCSKEKDYEKFIGEWDLVQADFDTPNLDSSFVSAAKYSLEASFYYFEEDDYFLIEDTSFTGGSYTGNWVYDAQKKQLKLDYTDLPIDPEFYEVLKISRNKLVIRQNLESVGILEYQLERRY